MEPYDSLLYISEAWGIFEIGFSQRLVFDEVDEADDDDEVFCNCSRPLLFGDDCVDCHRDSLLLLCALWYWVLIEDVGLVVGGPHNGCFDHAN